MSGVGPVDLFVDLDKLDELGRELQTLITKLDAVPSGSCPDGSETGSQDVSDAVQRFEHSWQYGRRHLTDQLTACLALVELAARSYRSTEHGLVVACDGPDPTTNGSP